MASDEQERRERRLARAKQFAEETASWSSEKLRACYAQPEAVAAALLRERDAARAEVERLRAEMAAAQAKNAKLQHVSDRLLHHAAYRPLQTVDTDIERLRPALARLSIALGYPALEWGEDSTIEAALVYHAAREVERLRKERDEARAEVERLRCETIAYSECRAEEQQLADRRITAECKAANAIVRLAWALSQALGVDIARRLAAELASMEAGDG